MVNTRQEIVYFFAKLATFFNSNARALLWRLKMSNCVRVTLTLFFRDFLLSLSWLTSLCKLSFPWLRLYSKSTFDDISFAIRQSLSIQLIIVELPQANGPAISKTCFSDEDIALRSQMVGSTLKQENILHQINKSLNPDRRKVILTKNFKCNSTGLSRKSFYSEIGRHACSKAFYVTFDCVLNR